MNPEILSQPSPESEEHGQITPENERMEPRKEFQGQDAEVTVKRTDGKIEGGWEVTGPAKKEGYVIVFNRKQNKEKTVNAEKLLELQDFRKGKEVPVIRSDETLDPEGWVISASSGDGVFQVEKTIDGKVKTKILTKLGTPGHPGLIDAEIAYVNTKIADLEKRRGNIVDWNDRHPDDREILAGIAADLKLEQDNLKYWQDKKETAERLSKESKMGE